MAKTGCARQTTRPPIALSKFGEDAGVSEATLYRWRKRGLLRVVNIFGKNYIPADCVEEFNRRAEAGEFARDPKPPRKKEDAI